MSRAIKQKSSAVRGKGKPKPFLKNGTTAQGGKAVVINAPDETGAASTSQPPYAANTRHDLTPSAQIGAVTAHPLAEVIGYLKGDIWEEIRQERELERQKNNVICERQTPLTIQRGLFTT